MNGHFLNGKNCTVFCLAISSGLIVPLSANAARNPQEAQQKSQQVQQEGQQRQQQVQQQAQERVQQAQQMRQQQEQGRQQQEQEMKQAAQARQQQEQNLRQQEQQARQQQQQGRQQAEQQARQQQEQGRQQAEQQARQQQEQGRQQAEQQARQQQEQGRQQAEQQARQQQEQGRQAQEQARQQQEQGRQVQERQAQEHVQPEPTSINHQERGGGGPYERAPGQPGAFARDRGGAPVAVRDQHPPALPAHRMPLDRAIAMPMIPANANPEDREHLQQVQRNLQAHLIAVSEQDRPSNINVMRDYAREQYFNNYQATIANQQYVINRQNTFINALEQNQWPTWYQPQPNYQFCNGFTFGNSIQADLNWLRWGWHPYYGPQPEGFVCARDYAPTPWIYIPAYGTWRQPGINAYVPYGPPEDYTGPISVEVFEPRQVNVSVPFGGWMPQQVINAVYFYNAYYFPEAGRYGYMNRHGNWIWLNLDAAPF